MPDYQLQLASDQARLAEFAADAQLLSLEREIGAMRLLFERTLAAGNTSQTTAIATVIGKLVTQYEASAARKHEWLSKRVILHELLPKIIGAIATEVQALPGGEEALDRILENLTGSVLAAENNVKKKDILMVTGKKQ